VLAIPVVVGLGAAWYTEQQRKVSDRENTDNQRETALQAYIDNMSELLLDANRPLRESKPEDEVQTIARARTLTVLPRLDANRKGSVLLFLYESGLIYKDKFFIDLRAADLSKADLSKVDLSGANLSRANLNIAKMASADLRRADLSRAELRANLHLADLRGADLHGANLVSAVLIEADLREANLSGANVFRATVTSEQLEKAKSLKGTTMPDGSIHP
jgi:Pentapeptide repeats (8 copies)